MRLQSEPVLPLCTGGTCGSETPICLSPHLPLPSGLGLDVRSGALAAVLGHETSLGMHTAGQGSLQPGRWTLNPEMRAPPSVTRPLAILTLAPPTCPGPACRQRTEMAASHFRVFVLRRPGKVRGHVHGWHPQTTPSGHPRGPFGPRDSLQMHPTPGLWSSWLGSALRSHCQPQPALRHLSPRVPLTTVCFGCHRLPCAQGHKQLLQSQAGHAQGPGKACSHLPHAAGVTQSPFSSGKQCGSLTYCFPGPLAAGGWLTSSKWKSLGGLL